MQVAVDLLKYRSTEHVSSSIQIWVWIGATYDLIELNADEKKSGCSVDIIPQNRRLSSGAIRCGSAFKELQQSEKLGCCIFLWSDEVTKRQRFCFPSDASMFTTSNN